LKPSFWSRPKRTFFQLIDPSQLDPPLPTASKIFRSNGTVAKVNLALAGFLLSRRSMRPKAFSRLSPGESTSAPEIDYLERAFDASKYGEFSKAPYPTSPFPQFSIRRWLPKANMSSLPAFNMLL